MLPQTLRRSRPSTSRCVRPPNQQLSIRFETLTHGIMSVGIRRRQQQRAASLRHQNNSSALKKVSDLRETAAASYGRCLGP